MLLSGHTVSDRAHVGDHFRRNLAPRTVDMKRFRLVFVLSRENELLGQRRGRDNVETRERSSRKRKKFLNFCCRASSPIDSPQWSPASHLTTARFIPGRFQESAVSGETQLLQPIGACLTTRRHFKDQRVPSRTNRDKNLVPPLLLQ